MTQDNGDAAESLTEEDRLRQLHEAVKDVPDPEPTKVTPEVVKELREAGDEELAEVAEVYV
jgi:hypothetical protein